MSMMSTEERDRNQINLATSTNFSKRLLTNNQEDEARKQGSMENHKNLRKNTILSILTTILFSELVSITLVSGGVFTTFLQNKGLETPILELSFMYIGLSFYLIYHFTQKGKYTETPLWKFFVIAMFDVHGNILVVKAFEFTSITSVMLLQVFSIPCALLLSITFLKVKYSKNHYVALLFCAGGVTFSMINDLIMHPRASEGGEGEYGERFNWDAFIGDLMVLTSSVMFASQAADVLLNSSNILQEHTIKQNSDVFNYLGFLGLFGTIITLIEGLLIFREYEQFGHAQSGATGAIISYYFGFVAFNFFGYTIVPWFIKRYGATLFNMSNLTSIIWSMISDICLFDRPFVRVYAVHQIVQYWMYLCGFILEIIAIGIYSLKPPLKQNSAKQESQQEDVLNPEIKQVDRYWVVNNDSLI